ncbi:GIY-YIG nuclease family protein [Leptospira wolffii]|uniref:GIY-YIG nuclease family protein n=1 Tax=Leptospira wolffii TaxID=409998 RepID=UPI0035CD23DB
MNYNEEEIPKFEDIVKSAEAKIKKVDMVKYCFYDLYKKIGNEYIKDLSKLDSKITLDHKSEKDFKGLYILFDESVVQYVGISKNVLLRIKQHFLSNSHYSASLVYLMALKDHEQSVGGKYKYKGLRKDLPNFKKYRSDQQEIMRNQWRISFIPEEDSFHLHVLEAYAACELKAKWNSFQTH